MNIVLDTNGFDPAVNQDFTDAEGESGTLVKSGEGKLILDGASAFAGLIKVTEGALEIGEHATFAAVPVLDLADEDSIVLPDGGNLDVGGLTVAGERKTAWVVWGAGAPYAVGSFDGHVFKPYPDHERLLSYPQSTSLPYYAGQAFQNAPDGRCVYVPWYMLHGEGPHFAQHMGLPQELALVRTNAGLRLTRKPVRELEALRDGAAVPEHHPETVFSDWLRCIVPPPVSNAKDEDSSSSSSSSSSSESLFQMALTFHVSLLTRSVTSTSSSSMSATACPSAFVLAAESAASSSAASKTMYGISISVTFPLALTFWSRSE